MGWSSLGCLRSLCDMKTPSGYIHACTPVEYVCMCVCACGVNTPAIVLQKCVCSGTCVRECALHWLNFCERSYFKCVCACVRACVHACVRACVCV